MPKQTRFYTLSRLEHRIMDTLPELIETQISFAEWPLLVNLYRLGVIDSCINVWLNDDGWRCMFGKTEAEVMAIPEDQPSGIRKVYRVPIRDITRTREYREEAKDLATGVAFSNQ